MILALRRRKKSPTLLNSADKNNSMRTASSPAIKYFDTFKMLFSSKIKRLSINTMSRNSSSEKELIFLINFKQGILI